MLFTIFFCFFTDPISLFGKCSKVYHMCSYATKIPSILENKCILVLNQINRDIAKYPKSIVEDYLPYKMDKTSKT